MAALALALATFVSEDLTCLAAGLLVARGEMGFIVATLACGVGIAGGDLLLFGTGRMFTPFAERRWPAQIARGSEWLTRHGAAAVFLSRFVPGLRLPTYLAAGIARTNVRRFALYFFAAAAIWTPLLVGSAALFGRTLPRAAWIVVAAMALAIGFATSRRRRRLFVSHWRRLTHWEFWPAWLTYLPLLPYLLWLGLKHRSMSAFTACNPMIPASGVVGESKYAILRALRSIAPTFVPETRRVTAADDVSQTFPIVLKPDAGQRGSGVVIARSSDDVARYFASFHGAAIAQEYVEGPELGIFYVRYPGSEKGRILSVTEKRLLFVTGDGRRTLEELILNDARAVALAPLFLKRFASRAGEVPAAGERVRLVELGTHCRGAVFLDGRRLLTPELERAIDEISRGLEGFHFGRYDVRAASMEALQAGDFKVLELNGVTSEATHIYDPSVGIVEAYRALFEQWRIAFEIGAINRCRGARTTSAIELLRRFADYRHLAASHPQ